MLVNKTYSTNTYTTISFGDGSTANSQITGIGFAVPSSNEMQSYRFMSGDIVGFILGGYAVMGPTLYLAVIFMFSGTLYLRHKGTGPIVVFFMLFTFSGVSVWAFVPAYAATVVYIILALIATFAIWKLIR
jgi:phosphate starvation-inducible membrane PsiE